MLVTISRQSGSDGDVIAVRVAAAAGLQLVDREHVCRIAVAAGVAPELLHRLLYEGQRSLGAEILAALRRPGPQQGIGPGTGVAPPGGLLAPMMPPDNAGLEEAAQMLGLIVKEIASRDNVLVLGQGGQVLLRDYQGACHVQIVAPLAWRAARVATAQGISAAAARRQVRRVDRDRAGYLARYRGVNWLDPMLYHLVINTGRMPVEPAVSLIVGAAQAIEAAARP